MDNETMLKAHEVIEIREAKGRVLGRDLAKKYGVTTGVIYAIQNNKAYRWVRAASDVRSPRASVTREDFYDAVDNMVEWEGFAPPNVRAMVKMLRHEGVKIVRKVRYEIID